ncbi:MAG: nucleoside deaminase [Rickettsiales bacterium]|nr:nucleoside deaminase [Rickettsiales bacterium]
MADKKLDFMRAAMKCAIRALKHDDVPIGAVIVRNGKIIAQGENRVQKAKDPTAHAEIIAIKSACRKLEKKFLDGCEIYVTLEPCAMCAAAISFARIKKIIYSADDPKGGGINYGAKVYENDIHLWRPIIEKDFVYSDSSSKMLKVFFQKLRVKNIKKNMRNMTSPAKDIKERAKAIKKTIKQARKGERGV